MEILIKENAADNYFRRCYKGTRPDAVGLHNEGFYNILKGLQGKWVEVDTTHLFANQFNTVVIEGVTGSDGYYSGDFSVPSVGEYLYMIWDYRQSLPLTLCYSDVSQADACCNCEG